LHWEELPIAIEPDELGAIFSGSAVIDYNNTSGFKKGEDNSLVAIYSADMWNSNAFSFRTFALLNG